MVKVKGWICRALGGSLLIFTDNLPPKKTRGTIIPWYWAHNDRIPTDEITYGPVSISEELYPSITIDSRPKRVEISIRLSNEQKSKRTKGTKSTK